MNIPLKMMSATIVTLMTLMNASCSSVVPKTAPALETLEKWHASSGLVPPNAPKDPFNKNALLVNARISSLQQSVTDSEPMLVTKVDFGDERLADIKPEVDAYLATAPKAPADATSGVAVAIGKWLLDMAKEQRKASADAARKRLDGYRWKLRQ
jgi:hypothetical protein